jgi:hypothetical protein
MHLKDGRRIDLTGLSDENTLWQLRRVATAAEIVSTTHAFGPEEGASAVAHAQRLERLWAARWN